MEKEQNEEGNEPRFQSFEEFEECTNQLVVSFNECRPFGDHRDFQLFDGCELSDIWDKLVSNPQIYEGCEEVQALNNCVETNDIVCLIDLNSVFIPDYQVEMCVKCVEHAIDVFKGLHEKWTCPRCGEETIDHPAISREDDTTEICSECGLEEAFENFHKL